MKKRWTAILLAAALVLALLPAGAFAAETVPEGWTPIYTLADIKECYSGKYILMNDIDASKEDVAYDGNGYDANSVGGRLFSGGILDGNGHTIYNLKGPLFQYNMGTIKNLNVTISNIKSNTETSYWDIFTNSNVFAGIALYNSNGGSTGLIENCNVVMTVDSRFTTAGNLHIYGISSGGTIRNCIAKLDFNIRIDDQKGTLYAYGIGPGTNDSLVDHCLVLGNISIDNGSGAVEFAGISDCTATDSACALENLSVIRSGSLTDGPYDVFSLACLNGLAGTSGINNRVASDMNVYYQFGGDKTIDGEPGSGEGYTLASRSSILADWDLSGLPGEAPDNIPSTKPTEPEETVEDPFPAGKATFHFSGSSGEKEHWSFYYANSFFYSQDTGYGYNADLAKASLCVEMASFSDCENLCWDETLPGYDTRRATNILELYDTLGFTNARCVNYDKALTDTSDKVAYSMAVKYIDNGKGGKDTLVVLPIRGGGYGGEWSSNFHLFGNTNSLSGNHIGFQTAAEDVKKGLDSYVKELDIQGDLKLWVTGFSRGAATANLLGRILNNSTVGGVSVSRSDIYVYTFATPAGASYRSVEKIFDPNIFNIVSPVDLVPRVAPSKWEFTHYGTTLTLPCNNYDLLWERFYDISSTWGKEIKESQRTVLDTFCQEAFTQRNLQPTLFGSIPYTDVQKDVMGTVGNLLGKNQYQEISGSTVAELVTTLGIKSLPTAVRTISKLSTIGEAHYPEYYLARLESDVLCSEEDFEKASHVRSVLVYPPDSDQVQELDIDVEFWNASKKSAGSYVSGVCTSGEVTVEMTDLGLVATFPAGKDYTFTLTGAGADSINFTIFAYDNDTPDGPARTMNYTDYGLEDDTYTVYVPEDPYDDYYVEDQDGFYYVPDYDSLVDGELPVVEVSFTDVSPNAYYYDAVQWAVENGITSGTSATTFSPDMVCTRAQAVTFLWRAAGSPRPESTRNPFTDVKAGSYYYDAVLWAVEEGITSGTSATTFSPDMTCSRSQIVTLLYRSWGNPEIEEAASFRDVPAGAYYAEAVSWAAEWGITSGTSATTFSPDASCTRAQIVTFLYRSYC